MAKQAKKPPHWLLNRISGHSIRHRQGVRLPPSHVHARQETARESARVMASTPAQKSKGA